MIALNGSETREPLRIDHDGKSRLTTLALSSDVGAVRNAGSLGRSSP